MESETLYVFVMMRPVTHEVFGFPWLVYERGRTAVYLTGDTAKLMRTWHDGPMDCDLAGVLADRMDDYPEETEDEDARRLIVWFLRRLFYERRMTTVEP